MPKIDAVIFDIGGVLVRTEDPAPREALAKRYGFDRAGIDTLVFSSPAAQAAERGEKPEEAVWYSVQTQLGLSYGGIADFAAQFWAGDRLDERLLHWLAGLRRRGVKTGLLTNAWFADPFAMLVDRYHVGRDWLEANFDAAVSSAGVGVQKPDPRIYQAIVAKLDVPAESTLFVDDYDRNITGAKVVGLQTLLFRDAVRTMKAIETMLESVG